MQSHIQQAIALKTKPVAQRNEMQTSVDGSFLQRRVWTELVVDI